MTIKGALLHSFLMPWPLALFLHFSRTVLFSCQNNKIQKKIAKKNDENKVVSDLEILAGKCLNLPHRKMY